MNHEGLHDRAFVSAVGSEGRVIVEVADTAEVTKLPVARFTTERSVRDTVLARVVTHPSSDAVGVNRGAIVIVAAVRRNKRGVARDKAGETVRLRLTRKMNKHVLFKKKKLETSKNSPNLHQQKKGVTATSASSINRCYTNVFVPNIWSGILCFQYVLGMKWRHPHENSQASLGDVDTFGTDNSQFVLPLLRPLPLRNLSWRGVLPLFVPLPPAEHARRQKKSVEKCHVFFSRP